MAGGLTDAEIEARLRAAPSERWQALWAAVAALEGDPEPGRWAGGDTVEGVIQLPYVVYSDAALDVVARVFGLGASEPFDWPEWDGPARYPDGRGLAAAPVAESIRMITAIVRADRFAEGTLLAGLERGALAAALDRLRRWYEEEAGAPDR